MEVLGYILIGVIIGFAVGMAMMYWLMGDLKQYKNNSMTNPHWERNIPPPPKPKRMSK
jgi:hypothetical protein